MWEKCREENAIHHNRMEKLEYFILFIYQVSNMFILEFIFYGALTLFSGPYDHCHRAHRTQ
jgi:hypothetical protein